LTAVWDFTSISPDLGGVTLDDKGNLYVAGFANDQATATYELDPETGKLLHHWPSTGEMFAYDATHAALDVTDFNWSNVRQFLLGN
jgi:DNA-binding beta-propeller fold protein YncE